MTDAPHTSRTEASGESEGDAFGSSSGRIVVISAPSGAGKTSITHRLLAAHPGWCFAVSATTRAMRKGEQDGVDYYFLTESAFRSKVDAGEMVEWEEIYGNLYGTMRHEVERLLSNQEVRRVLFDIDVKGALSLRKAFPNDAVLIFIAPPSIQALEQRLTQRMTETPEALGRRLQRAAMEMDLQREFDYVVVNDQLDQAVKEVEYILRDDS